MNSECMNRRPPGRPAHGKLGQTVAGLYTSDRSTEDTAETREFVMKFLPIVKEEVARARIRLPDFIDFDDLNGAAVCALMKAFKRYGEEDTKESFGGYVRLRVRGAIVDELRRLDVMSRTTRKKLRQYEAAVIRIEQQHGRPATEDEIRAELNLDRQGMSDLLDQLRPVSFLSLDKPLDEEAAGETVSECIEDHSQATAREKLEKKDFLDALKNRLHELPDIERKVLHMYYFKELRLSEIALAFNLSESRVCQIHTKAIRGLRAYMTKISGPKRMVS